MSDGAGPVAVRRGGVTFFRRWEPLKGETYPQTKARLLALLGWE